MLQIRPIPACPYLWGVLYLYGIKQLVCHTSLVSHHDFGRSSLSS